LCSPETAHRATFSHYFYRKLDVVNEIWKYLRKPQSRDVGQLNEEGTAVQVATVHDNHDAGGTVAGCHASAS
jgi:hypothetical protein